MANWQKWLKKYRKAVQHKLDNWVKSLALVHFQKNVECWGTSKVHQQKKGTLAKGILSQGVKDTSRNNLCLFHKFVEQCY
jgi:hypothetical protein